MKKALVTGGAGFIGTNLIKQLKHKGLKVVSIDNYSTGSKLNEIKGVDYLEYKEVNGVKFPSVITMKGAADMKLVAEIIEVNTGIKDSEFSVE